jgi:hypothetical protein
MTEERALAVATCADCGVSGVDCGMAWGDMNAGEAAEDEGEAI